MQAWSPLGAGAVLRDRTIQTMATALGRSPAQIVLRRHLQRGDMALPKAISLQRIQENLAISDFTLDATSMDRIDVLDRGEGGRSGPHPGRM